MVTFEKAESWEQLETQRGMWLLIDTPRGASAICSCPGCGERWALDGWTITPDGKVHPSVDHSPSGCKFHDNIELKQWTTNRRTV